jgi:hypothetical protein
VGVCFQKKEAFISIGTDESHHNVSMEFRILSQLAKTQEKLEDNILEKLSPEQQNALLNNRADTQRALIEIKRVCENDHKSEQGASGTIWEKMLQSAFRSLAITGASLVLATLLMIAADMYHDKHEGGLDAACKRAGEEFYDALSSLSKYAQLS